MQTLKRKQRKSRVTYSIINLGSIRFVLGLGGTIPYIVVVIALRHAGVSGLELGGRKKERGVFGFGL